MVSKVTGLAIVFPLLIFTWEHIALINNINVKPTTLINLVTLVMRDLWKTAGIIFFNIFEYLHLDKLLDTCKSFCYALFELVRSVEYFQVGFPQVRQFLDSYIVKQSICGFVLIVLLAIGCNVIMHASRQNEQKCI